MSFSTLASEIDVFIPFYRKGQSKVTYPANSTAGPELECLTVKPVLLTRHSVVPISFLVVEAAQMPTPLICC